MPTGSGAADAGGADASVDVVVIGAGPAGLSAALNLVRTHRRTLVVDSNRPRNAATLHSHGYLTRDGVPPLELRRLGREEFTAYPAAEFQQGIVQSVSVMIDGGFAVDIKGMRQSPTRRVTAKAVVVSTGLTETLPAIPSLRAYYGTHLHSCIECDGYEKSDLPLALIGETPDLAERALLIAQYSPDLTVFTNASAAVTPMQERVLTQRGIRVEHRPIADVVGEKAEMTGVALADGEIIPCTSGFIRPTWSPVIGFLDGLDITVTADGYVATDDFARTNVPGLYVAGDASHGPQQLIVAAGVGAVAAATIHRDLIGPQDLLEG